MNLDRWSPVPDSPILGVPVHGPAVVARSAGIVMAVRCVFARPDGLELDLVLAATGVQAEAAGRQSFHESGPTSDPELLVQLDGRSAVAYPERQSSSGGDDDFSSELHLSVDRLPADGRVTLTASWPQAGLAEGSVTLVLGPLDDLESHVVRLSS